MNLKRGALLKLDAPPGYSELWFIHGNHFKNTPLKFRDLMDVYHERVYLPLSRSNGWLTELINPDANIIYFPIVNMYSCMPMGWFKSLNE